MSKCLIRLNRGGLALCRLTIQKYDQRWGYDGMNR